MAIHLDLFTCLQLIHSPFSNFIIFFIQTICTSIVLALMYTPAHIAIYYRKILGRIHLSHSVLRNSPFPYSHFPNILWFTRSRFSSLYGRYQTLGEYSMTFLGANNLSILLPSFPFHKFPNLEKLDFWPNNIMSTINPILIHFHNDLCLLQF